MSLPGDLLEQANHLANREPKKPKQASLGRAVSAAYYALFHLLTSEAARRLGPNTPAGLHAQIKRAFNHGSMKEACQEFARTKIPKSLDPFIAGAMPQDLVDVAKAFVSLQQARHDADYNLAKQYSRQGVLADIEKAANAFQSWKKVRSTAEANVFLTALLLWKQWRVSSLPSEKAP